MTWVSTSRPSDHRVASSDKWKEVFHANENVVLSLTDGAATTFQIRNYYGTVVASGAIPSGATDLNLGLMPCGWYRAYFVRGTPAGSPWYSAGGETMFCVVRGLSMPTLLADRPADGTPRVDTGGDYWINGLDIPAHAYTGFGHTRSGLSYSTNVAPATAACGVDADYFTEWYVNDPARPIHSSGMCEMGDSYGYVDDETKNTIIGDVVSLCVPKGMTYFEGMNEPNSQGVSVANMITQTTLFSNAVHAASASAKVLSPCTISVAEQYSGWFKDVLAGAASYIDVVSFHNYTGGSGELPVQRRVLDNFLAAITAAGVTSKPRYNSEFGSAFMAVYGSFEPRVQSQNIMLELMMCEQYGVPKENVAYFYDWQHGFWDFPSWWIQNEGNEPHPGPLMALLRTYSEELAGKAYAARLDFGTIENDHYVGSRFTNPNDGTSVVAVMSGGRYGSTVTLSIGGAAPPQNVTVIDPWGNSSTVDVLSGLVTIDVEALPTYVRLPTGNTAAPEIVDYGIEVVRAQRSSATASSQRADDVQEGIHSVYSADKAIDGIVDANKDGSLPTGWWRVCYSGAETDSMPQYLDILFPRETRFDTVVVQTPAPWQHMSGLIDFDVQAWNSDTSEWDVVATHQEPTNTFQWASPQQTGNCFSDCYYSRCTVFVFRLEAAVATTKIRVYARQTTEGSEAIAESRTGYGVAGGECGQGSPEHLTLQEVSVFLSGHTDGNAGLSLGTKMLVIPAPGT